MFAAKYSAKIISKGCLVDFFYLIDFLSAKIRKKNFLRLQSLIYNATRLLCKKYIED